MNRREFVKQAIEVTAVGTVAPTALPEISDRNYNSATISVRLVEDGPDRTSIYLTEHGDADYVVIEAFYWNTLGDQRLLLHKEATTILMKDATVAADIPLAQGDIVFLRIKEMHLLNQSEFGKVPK